MKEMLSKAFDTKQTTQTFLVNIKKNHKKEMIWPYSNQNILSKEVTTEPTRYLCAKRQALISSV